jgi:hypothetical protein
MNLFFAIINKKIQYNYFLCAFLLFLVIISANQIKSCLLAKYNFISHQRKKVNFFVKLICTISIDTKSREDIKYISSKTVSKGEKARKYSLGNYNSAFGKEKLCLLKEMDRTEYIFYISRLDRTKIHLE